MLICISYILTSKEYFEHNILWGDLEKVTNTLTTIKEACLVAEAQGLIVNPDQTIIANIRLQIIDEFFKLLGNYEAIPLNPKVNVHRGDVHAYDKKFVCEIRISRDNC